MSFRISTCDLILRAAGCAAIALIAPLAAADHVHATYAVAADGFECCGGLAPPAPASTQVSGTYTFSFDTSQVQQFNIVPTSVVGLDITDREGNTVDYDPGNSGVDTEVRSFDNSVRIVIGGTMAQVAFMVGSSNDFRVTFDVSMDDYSVVGIVEQMLYVTEVDPFYDAQTTSVQLISVDIQPDSDNDGILDVDDNCQFAANSSQRDTNGDGFGNACDPDFNQDCVVNAADLGVMRANFFVSGDIDTDLDGDGQTNVGDLGILRSLYFGAPGPSGPEGPCVP